MNYRGIPVADNSLECFNWVDCFVAKPKYFMTVKELKKRRSPCVSTLGRAQSHKYCRNESKQDML